MGTWQIRKCLVKESQATGLTTFPYTHTSLPTFRSHMVMCLVVAMAMILVVPIEMVEER